MPQPTVTSNVPTSPTPSPPPDTGLAQMVATTPASRDRYVDFLRGLAIAMVAIGHWLVVVPGYADGNFDGVNALGTVPLMRWLSWAFQVMPLFFMVGGYANALSWSSAQRRGERWSTWARTRFGRLMRPTVVFLAFWVVLALVARQLGVDPHLVHTMAWLVVVPLWFLAVYVVIVALAPPMLWLHERIGLVVLLALVVAAAVVDVGRIHFGLEAVAYLNFLFVFGYCQQLGFFWRDGRLTTRTWWPPAMLGAGVTALWLLTHVGPYPISMVGVPGEPIANSAPPTVTFVALGLAQAGLVLLLRRPMDRWLQRPRVWASVIGVNAHAMTIHLWHFTALVAVAVVVLPWNIVPVFESGSVAWWASRWAVLPVLSIPLIALVAVFGRFERRPARPRVTTGHPAVHAAATVAAVPCLSVGFTLVTLNGLSIESVPTGFPIWSVTLLVVGLGLLRLGERSAEPRVDESDGISQA
jgi:fucose 4-O-acetylase-like acetyltransferase